MLSDLKSHTRQDKAHMAQIEYKKQRKVDEQTWEEYLINYL